MISPMAVRLMPMATVICTQSVCDIVLADSDICALRK